MDLYSFLRISALSFVNYGLIVLQNLMYVWSCSLLKSEATAWFSNLCILTICWAIRKSWSSFFSSNITKKMSNLDMMGGEMSTLNLRDLVLSYRPKIGFAAANTEALAFRVAWIPALARDMVYCSMASWIAVWSLESILSNSSIQQTPWSASMSAPASMQKSPVSGSLSTEAVRPAADEDLPVV